MSSEDDLRLEERDGAWALVGAAASQFGMVDEYLAYLAGLPEMMSTRWPEKGR